MKYGTEEEFFPEAMGHYCHAEFVLLCSGVSLWLLVIEILHKVY
jgi:heme exporter protein D